MANESNEFYAIVVEVPKQEKICFMAIPFGGDFKGISDSVWKAASELEYQPLRTDKIRKAPDFVQAIYEKIRSAKIIVAVCSPDPGNNDQPNPNVMYELGLAHSLGKPTLIMTNNMKSLPIDIQTKEVLEYRREDEREGSLILQIKDKMVQIEKNTQGHLIERGWKGISLAYAEHRMLLEPDFWDKFQIILRFAKLVHHELQALESPHMGSLLTQVGEIVSNPKAGLKKAVDFDTTWDGFSNMYYGKTQRELFDNLPGLQGDVERSFDYLSISPDPDIKKTTSKSKTYYNIINERLKSFEPIFERIEKKKIGGSFLPLLKIEETTQELYREIRELAYTTRHLLIQADELMRNLIELILSKGE